MDFLKDLFGFLWARKKWWLAPVVIVLLLLGVLLALPIPVTNYVFGFLLLLFAFALLERDGALLLVAWVAGGIAVVVFGFLSGNLVEATSALLARWF